jgi:hypothetical protein
MKRDKSEDNNNNREESDIVYSNLDISYSHHHDKKEHHKKEHHKKHHKKEHHKEDHSATSSHQWDVRLNHFRFAYLNSVPVEVQKVCEYAGQITSKYFEKMRRPITVNVWWKELGQDVLAYAGPTAFYKARSARYGIAWIPKALMKQRVKDPIDMRRADIELSINSLGWWYAGLDGQVPLGFYDLVTVVIHELQHGMGIISMVGNAEKKFLRERRGGLRVYL